MQLGKERIDCDLIDSILVPIFGSCNPNGIVAVPMYSSTSFLPSKYLCIYMHDPGMDRDPVGLSIEHLSLSKQDLAMYFAVQTLSRHVLLVIG